METTTITKAEVQRAINATLDQLFKEPVKKGAATSFEQICAEIGTTTDKVLPYPNPVTDDDIFSNASRKCRIITKYINGDWRPDWKNKNQYKWYVWMVFDENTAAFRFDNSNFDNACSHAGVGSRFVFETEEKANHFGRTFLKEINEYMLYSNL